MKLNLGTFVSTTLGSCCLVQTTIDRGTIWIDGGADQSAINNKEHLFERIFNISSNLGLSAFRTAPNSTFSLPLVALDTINPNRTN